jgi:hypothetical protein
MPNLLRRKTNWEKRRPVGTTDYIGKKGGLLLRMLSALGHPVSGLAPRASHRL